MFKILYSLFSMNQSSNQLSNRNYLILIFAVTFLSLMPVKAAFDPAWIKLQTKYSKLTPEASKILMQKCKDCHTANTEYPFY